MFAPPLMLALALGDGGAVATSVMTAAPSNVAHSAATATRSDSSPVEWSTAAGVAYAGSLAAGGAFFLLAFDAFTLAMDVPGYCGAWALGCSSPSVLVPLVRAAISAGVPYQVIGLGPLLLQPIVAGLAGGLAAWLLLGDARSMIAGVVGGGAAVLVTLSVVAVGTVALS